MTVENKPEATIDSPNYEELLSDITEKINEMISTLTNDIREDDAEAKIQWIQLSQKFDNSFKEYLTKHPDKAEILANTVWEYVKKLADKFKKDWTIPEDFRPLIEFLKGIWIKLETAGLETENLAQNEPEIPKLSLKWNLNWINAAEAWGGQIGDDGLYDWLTRESIELDNIDDKKNLNKTINTIKEQMSKLDELLQNDKLKNNTDLTNLKTILENINNVIYNTTPENVKKLQEFIYNNLNDDGDKNNFNYESKMKWNGFDWKFWDGTLEWLNIILKQIWDFINSLENYINENKKNEEDENVDVSNLDNVTAKEGLTIEKGDVFTDIYKPENLVENLPNWATVTFIDDHIDTNTLWDINVKVNVSLWETNKEIVVTVKVINDEEDKDSKKDVSTTDTNAPLQLGDGVQQQTYLVMKNCPINLQYYPELYGATFYSTQPCENWQNFLGDGQPKLTEYTGEFLWEREYYLKLDKYPNKLYKIKVDSCGCICPIATEIFCNLKNRNWSPVERKVLLANNESCKQYLRNKLFNWINAEIWWNEKLQDYTISSYWKTLTIEPMTLDNNWICDNLSQSLALLNFTNYLRGAWEIDGIRFVNDNPDLKHDEIFYVRVKRQDHPEGKRRYPIDSQKFCLCDINKDKIRNYIRYNNHEDWEDDWDKKRKNKGYTKVQL